ncbi:hypothetical protein Taro_042360 [Colocasia esculenta]|uniref:CTLH domain-containing protein n=1 Tax=Colocasia esculenta TaxID=4460 RepID=A0A843X2F9_COLES|nr:hypothetical protein [Colocasia esculenta]
MMDLDPRQYEHIAVGDSDVCNIVLSYLMHSCFKETAETFIGCSGMKQPVDYPADMDKRKSIFHFALEGNALKAIELTEQLAPNLLEQNKDLHFDLLSLHFVELIRAQKCTEALEFAQRMLTPFGRLQKYVEKLEDFMALLAYEEPEKSPMFHLLSLEHRQSVAENLNRAILGMSPLHPISACISPLLLVLNKASLPTTTSTCKPPKLFINGKTYTTSNCGQSPTVFFKGFSEKLENGDTCSADSKRGAMPSILSAQSGRKFLVSVFIWAVPGDSAGLCRGLCYSVSVV